jgi:hypothetical protein
MEYNNIKQILYLALKQIQATPAIPNSACQPEYENKM